MRILIYGAGVIGGKKHEKSKNTKSCRLLNLQKQQEDMKVTMLAYMKCARRIILIFWRSWRKSRLENCWMQDVVRLQ